MERREREGREKKGSNRNMHLKVRGREKEVMGGMGRGEVEKI